MNKTLRFILLGSLLLLLNTLAFSQVVINGKITDSNGEVLIGATVLESGTSNGVTTDIEGNYRIAVSQGTTLEFKYVGFISVTRTVSTQTVLNISLKEDVEELGEVIITALAFEANQDEIGYANTQVKNETVLKAAEPNLLNALSGKSTGLTIRRNSGDPGAGAFIQIRGQSTLSGGGQPLIIVDGIPINNDNRGTSQIAQQSRLNDINPNDIENISILKGALTSPRL